MNYIKSITVKNFFSIKNEITLDFKANQYTVDNHPDRVYKLNKEFYNKAIAIYGANASGKTSILKALVFVSAVINNQRDNFIPYSIRNKFNNRKSKTHIEVCFIISDKEYRYTITLSGKEFENTSIDDEILEELEENGKEILFERKKQSTSKEIIKNQVDIEIFNTLMERDPNIHKVLSKSILEKISQSKSIIQEFSKSKNDTIFKEIKSFFNHINKTSNIEFFNTRLDTREKELISIGENIENNPDIHKFIINFFDSIGLDIKDFEVIKEKNDLVESMEIFTKHTISKNKKLEFILESSGTKSLTKFLVDIFLAKENNSILVLDEFDSIIHPALVPMILNLLRQNDIQIIYTTHNIYNMKFLSHDELFLIEKDSTHNTKVIPVKDDKRYKGFENKLALYEANRLGGTPDIHKFIVEI